ncbi:MAG: hypothetical protein IPP29_19095 [Bacteroidetes bacterium]|nr:hypothetical protein [Bacteroidota bacterium]
MAIDTNNNIWIAIFGGQSFADFLYKYDGTNWTNYITPVDSIYPSLICDAKNNIWVCSQPSGYHSSLSKFDGINWTEFSVANQNLPFDSIQSLASDAKGNIYAFVYRKHDHGKLLFYDGTTWQDLNVSNYLPEWNYKITCDAKDNVYLFGFETLTIYNQNDGGIDPPWANAWANGKVVYDANNNQQVDGSDAPMFGQTIIQLPDSTLFGTDNNGNFSVPIKQNNSIIKSLPTADFHVNTDSLQYQLINITTDTCCYDFGLYSDTIYDNAQLAISHSTMRCGFTIPYSINVINKGTTILDGHVVLKLDSHCAVTYVWPTPFAINADSIVWDVTNMQPYSALNFNLDMTISNSTGDTVFTSAYFANQNYTTTYSLDDDVSVITCAYDPNAKSVEPLPYGWANYVVKGSLMNRGAMAL